MATAYSRGHKIIYMNGKWIYFDDKTPIKDNERPCIRCGRMPTKEGYDACLGFIDGLSSACCGHGTEKPYYIKNKRLNK